MPTPPPGQYPEHAAQSTTPSQAAIDANRLGTSLRAQGRFDEAARAFARGIDAQDGIAELHYNLGVTLTHLQRYDQARTSFLRAAALDANNAGAHFALYELEQMAGNRETALEHQRDALAVQTLYSAYAPQEERRLLVLLAPGDWQANVPVDYLVDPARTTVHRLFLAKDSDAGAALPSADAVFCAIAQSPENHARLEWAQRVVRRSGLPLINDPDDVARADRAYVYERLSHIDRVRVPQTSVADRDALRTIAFPAVVRPVGSQAGRDLAKIDDNSALTDYLKTTDAQSFYVMPFVDYSNADGYFRKYRIFVVDGVPLPCHLAISKHWMIHYYNAPMREHQWMRDEERTALEDFDSVFPEPLRRAMSEIASALHLDYVGLDCSIDRDGNLLVFEADPAMIVHAADDPQMFGYKHRAAHAIFDAFAALVDRARSV